MSSESSLKFNETNAKIPPGPEIVLVHPNDSGFERIGYEEEESITKEKNQIGTNTTNCNSKKAISTQANTAIVPHHVDPVFCSIERGEEINSDNNRNITVSHENNITNINETMVEAYIVPADKGSCFPETLFKTKEGKIKRKCWAIATAAIVCCIIIGVVVSMSSESSLDSSKEVDSSNESPDKTNKTPSISPPQTVETPSISPSQNVYSMPSNHPSVHPTAFNCLELCLAEIQEVDCPKDLSLLLLPCRLSPYTNLCMDDTKCVTNSNSPTCETSHQIYRRKVCPIDQPWKPSLNGFEYYIETRSMDWEAHKLRAMESNASLASIHYQSEMNFIHSMLSDSSKSSKAYIGGLRKGILGDPWNIGTDKYWKWVDNTPWNFTNWEVGQPDGQSTNEAHESVVLISDSKMYDTLPIYTHQGVYQRQFTEKKHIAFSLGAFHSCLSNLKDKLYCWGRNNNGQIGDGTIDRSYFPTKINLGSERTIAKISLGYYFSCIVLDGGELRCWGSNHFGQLGDGTFDRKLSPVKIDVGVGRSVTLLAVGFDHACAGLDDGTIKCWGRNSFGQVGDTTNNVTVSPTEIIPAGSQVMKIEVGGYHSCVVLNNGILNCWGWNLYGQLGDNTQDDRIYPTVISFDDGKTVKQVALGARHTCAVLDDDTLWCWGYNGNGQLGDNSTTDKYIPTKIIVDEKRKIRQIALGAWHTCAVLDDGALKCWGRNNYGQTGMGSTFDQKYPTEINVGIGRTVTQIELGGLHTCAILDDSTLRCWGQFSYGQLGVGASTHQYDASEAQYVAI